MERGIAYNVHGILSKYRKVTKMHRQVKAVAIRTASKTTTQSISLFEQMHSFLMYYKVQNIL